MHGAEHIFNLRVSTVTITRVFVTYAGLLCNKPPLHDTCHAETLN